MPISIEPVIVVFDKKGEYFQTWWGPDYPIEYGIKIANQIGGTYRVIKD